MEELPHPSYGDPDITIGAVQKSKEIFIKRLLRSEEVEKFVSLNASGRRPKNFVLYRADPITSDPIKGIKIYSLLQNEYDWSDVENGIMMKLPLFVRFRPKVKMWRKTGIVIMKIV